ncbi:MAG: 2-isopropylmalate synthase [Acidobacteria bacterium]|nr:2-isopropylmalate synthase [Acidobacteriota bacterium]
MNHRVAIFDTTLRDGEQSPGASMTIDEKVVIAKALEDLGVDIIEAGFPIASEGDFEAVQRVAQSVMRATVAGLARCHPKDIERAWQALAHALRPRIHVFLATSPIHRQYKLNLSKQQVLARVAEGVAMARRLCDDVEFSAEDAARTEPEFLVEVAQVALAAGATTFNVPDTVGYTTPDQFGDLVDRLMQDLPQFQQAVLSVHCHNDLGLAVANSLAAVKAGARQVECTINGIGERAGNCALEEVVMALRTRHDLFGLETGIDSRRIFSTSQLVSRVTGLHVQRNKAIVGQNAFAHEAGIHQHGVLQCQETYEIMKPEDVGVASSQLVLGKHSGRHAFKDWLNKQSFELSDAHFEKTFAAFKALADKKKTIYESDLLALVEGELQSTTGPWRIASLHTSAGTGTPPTAAISLMDERNVVHEEAACGDGPVDALFKAIERATGVRAVLKSYEIRSVTSGRDAQGEVSIEVSHGDQTYRGRSFSTDIIEASGHAMIQVINRLCRKAQNEADHLAEAYHAS